MIIERPLSTLTVVAGDTVLLTCIDRRVMPISVIWKKDGRPIQQFNYVTQQSDASLFVHAKNRAAAGQYQCKAKSERGEFTKVIVVRVQGERARCINIQILSLQRQYKIC